MRHSGQNQIDTNERQTIFIMSQSWIADRMHKIDASGIRKVFDLATKMKNPINLSIGQPHFDTPDSVKKALCQAVDEGRNVYSQSQGIAPLREALQKEDRKSTRLNSSHT